MIFRTKKDKKIENLRENLTTALKQNVEMQERILQREKAFEEEVKYNKELKGKMKALKKEVEEQLDRNDYGAIEQKLNKIREIIQDF